MAQTCRWQSGTPAGFARFLYQGSGRYGRSDAL
ncbi:Uncharacterised protein [Vibrio cholerae]|nr:Uncharacterised protein [Vibrio cholerae]